MKKIAMGLVALVGVAVATSAFFLSDLSASANLQLKGYDPVSYFVSDAPTLGDSRYSVKHQGATYHFSNNENRTAFVNDPQKFMPEYDGHCSYGVSLGQKFDIDPQSCDSVLHTVLPIAYEHSLSVYDAMYLELSLRLGLPLATLDGELGTAAKAAGVEVL